MPKKNWIWKITLADPPQYGIFHNIFFFEPFPYLLAEPVTVKVIMFNKSKNVERYLKPVIENPILTRKFGKCVTFQPEKGAMKVTVEVPLLTKVLSKII